MKVVVIYWTKSGNTEKVAVAIKDSIRSFDADCKFLKVEEAKDIDYFDYDLICFGFPCYRWRPPEPVDDFLVTHHKKYSKERRVKVGSPKLPGKHVIIFCTYSGPHTGINEAIPAAKYAAQFFEHLGFTVLDEIYVVGEFHSSVELSTRGRLGDVRGRPNDEDLSDVKIRVEELLRRL